MKASLVRIRDENLNDCLAFLKAREHRAISLASHLAPDGQIRPTGPGIKDCFALRGGSDGEIDGLILLTNTGILLHCLDEGAESCAELVSRRLEPANVRCILGAEPGTGFLEGLIGSRASRTVEYRLMTMTSCPSEKAPDDPDVGGCTVDRQGLRIRRCDASDAPSLLPLQEGYEREEVIPPGEPFSREACLANLSRTLSSQFVYAAFVGREPAAKAGTNARGIAWDQLGGVYTALAWRGKGLAAALVTHVVRERMAMGKKIALFVKIRNTSAIRVYEKVGFSPDIPFRISYL